MQSQQLVHLLRSTIIPWVTFPQSQRLVVARSTMRAADTPEGVTLEHRQLVGRRIVARGKRVHENQRLYTATWPEDNLQETTVPRISCVVNGVADHFLSQYMVTSGAGFFHIIPPGIPHQNYGPFLAGEHRRQGYCMLIHAYATIRGVWLWQTTSHNGQHVNDQTNNYLIYNPVPAQLLRYLMEEATYASNDAQSVCYSYLNAFFTIVAREIENDNYIIPGPEENKQPTSPRGTDFARQVQEYIEGNCHLPLRVDDVARHMYMSSPHFFRRMREETGTTFVEMLTNARIEQACYMLRSTDLSPAAIASKLSFRSVSHFQSLFRARTGHTPRGYRLQVRGSQEK
jgi:AraC-like DNA-binding protein